MKNCLNCGDKLCLDKKLEVCKVNGIWLYNGWIKRPKNK